MSVWNKGLGAPVTYRFNALGCRMFTLWQDSSVNHHNKGLWFGLKILATF